ncbi:TadE-like protein [Rubripirellula tenax]|uniref:TadE-like protein n=1 Tax=Rubripirellula tenax TaxID=2528015 RepID=A0A5C6FEJ8_9BACT|nr:TadE family protein [Rubripirellula tenax]TWU59911.1 TadE-like protein [Rubripirellula tenax]
MTCATIASRRRKGRSSRRSGVATIEFAIVLPLLITLTLGTIDVCSVMFLKESAVLAAYEGARQGVGRGRTNTDVVNRVTEFLDERGVQYSAGSVCTFSTPGFESAATLQNVTVTVNIPTAGNLLIPTERFADLIVTASVTMRKEYANLNN